MRRFDTIQLALFLAGWTVTLLSWLGIIAIAGNLKLTSLYPLYTFACTLGWSMGTLYVFRRRGLPERTRAGLLLLYYLGPQGLVHLLRAMTPLAFQKAAPWVPLYAFLVFSIFFLVPVKLLRLPQR